MSRFSKYIYIIICTFLTVCLFVACTDDKLIEPDSDTKEGLIEDPEGVYLTFTVNLDPIQGTRDEPSATDTETIIDEYDNKVDESTFQFLFFAENGDFLFQVDRNATGMSVQQTADGTGQWIVRIPLNNFSLLDSNGKSVLARVKAYLENNPFKIAALVNWHKEAPESGEPISQFKINWGWNESALNTVAKAANNVKNVNDLHHIDKDSNYSDSKRFPSYSFVMYKVNNENYMGLKTDWVKSTQNYNTTNTGFKDKRQVSEDFIRKYWNPQENDWISDTPNKDKMVINRYSNLWQLWNFGANLSNNGLTFADLNADFTIGDYKSADIWMGMNDFKGWLKNDNDGHLTEPLTDSKDRDKDNYNGLTFVPGNETETTDIDPNYDPSDDKYKNAKYSGKFSSAFTREIDGKKYYGVALGKSNFFYTYFIKDSNGNPTTSVDYYQLKTSSDHIAGYFKFTAPTSGILRIKYGCCDPANGKSNSKSRFIIQRNSNYMDKSNEVKYSDPKKIIDYEKEISITQDPETIYIYSVYDDPVIIYSIEYICDQYLYETDRQGVEQLIPMYGIQNFNKIDNWGTSSILNLSQGNNNINLIRSVAKVELYLPKKNYSYVGMRSMNRTSRCEPMDVMTPTDLAWNKLTGQSAHDATHCEWFDLKDYGKGYSTNAGENTVDSYKNWLSWFYGSWKQKFQKNGSANASSVKGTYVSAVAPSDWVWGFSSVTIPTKEYYPHIFNPSIDRSDYCEFIDKGEVKGMYNRYILYVPDKFIDDPNTVGDRSSSPKVMHIEYRSEKGRDEYLDDNFGHRIYFTNYSDSSNPIRDTYSDEFDDFEKTGLDYLWPVMRNHIYRFYIGSDYENLDVYVTVNDFTPHGTIKKEENW